MQNRLLSNTVKPPLPINTYNPGNIQNQDYKAKPTQISDLYNQDSTQNQYAAANAISQNLGDSQSQGIAQANAIVLNTAEYNPQGFQNQGYAAANTIVQNQGMLETAEANSIVYNAGEYNSKDLQSQGYAAANAITQNSGPYNSKGLMSQGMAEASAIAQSESNQLYGPNLSLQGSGQSLAEANAAYGGLQGSFKPYTAGISQNQGYAEGNALSQNSMNNPLYPGSYQSANALGSVNGQTSAEAGAEYISLPLISPHNTGAPQNQAYVEDNPGAPTLLSSSSAYQPPGSFQSAKVVGSVNNGETGGEEYVPLTVPYKDPLQTQYDPRIPQNPGYLGTIVTNEKFVSTTYKPPLQYGSYNLDNTQNKAYSEAVAQYNDRRTNTQKPLLVGQYSPGFTQNQASAQANAQYSSILTSTYKPPALYSQYNPAISQNLVHATPNALYKGTLSITDKPPPLYNPYNSGGSQIYPYSGANAIAQNSVTNQGYYLSGQYPSAKAVGSVNGGDQSSAKAETIAKSQDYSPYYQPGPKVGANSISNPSLGFPYQSNYYYQNPQYPSYSSKANTGLNGQYKASPVKYVGNYDFNGQADAMSIYSPQSSYNPYPGYSQSLASSNLYSPLYPNKYNYEITPLYRPGQYGTPNVQSTAEAFAGSKLQVKSGEGYKEDSDESK